MNILVTGGAGFIGSHLDDALIDRGHFVTVVDNLVLGKLDNISHLLTILILCAVSPNLENSIWCTI